MTPKERAAMQQALEALEVSTDWDICAKGKQLQSMKAITALRSALADSAASSSEALAKEKESMPITDDNGKAIRPQYRVIEQNGKWFLLYDQHQIGDRVEHEFRIQKVTHNILLYRGITLENAKAIFMAKVEGDDE